MLLPQSIQTYVFDLDNTLYDESLFVRGGTDSVVQWVAKKLCIEQDILHTAMNSVMVCYPRNEWYQRFLEKLGIQYSKQFIEQMIDVYRNHNPNISLFPDAAVFLAKIEKLKKRRNAVFLGLITDGLVSVQESKVKALQLQTIMNLCVFTWTKGAEYQKPHYWSFEYIEKESNTFGGACCYFGDDPKKDFITPNKLGWKTVCIFRKRSKLQFPNKEHEPHWRISSFNDIIFNDD